MLPAFDYVRPRSLDALLAALGQERCSIIAGGQSLLPDLAQPDGPRPAMLVDIAGIAALKGVRSVSGCVTIGAATTLADIAREGRSSMVPSLLLRAISGVANPMIRNRATIGGNIALGDPRSELPACLAVLGAGLEIVCADGARTVPADKFFARPRSVRLSAGELIGSVTIPLESADQSAALIKISPQAHGFATIGVAAIRSAGGSRLALFGTSGAARPLSLTAAALDRNGWSADDARGVEDTLRAELTDFDDVPSDPYRLYLAGILLRLLCRGVGWE